MVGVIRGIPIVTIAWRGIRIMLRLAIVLRLAVMLPVIISQLRIEEIMPCLRDRCIPLLFQVIDLCLLIAVRKGLIMFYILDLGLVVTLDAVDLVL